MRTVASPTQSNISDREGHSMMFRPSSSSPFSLTNLDTWEAKSRFTAQTSAWYDMATVSGSGFLSNVNTSTSDSTSVFRQNDPGLRKWQSLSHLVPEGAARSHRSSPRAELEAARGGSSYRQAEVMQWWQGAQELIDTQLDRLRTRDVPCNISTAEVLDMKNKQENAESFRFDKNLQRRELHEKVQKLEKDLYRMRSTLDRGGNDQQSERTFCSVRRTSPLSQEDLNRAEQKVDRDLCKLREALKDAEARAKTHEEERNRALQQLQTSTETQRALLSQIEEMNQRLNHMLSNHSDVQEELSQANNKISQACLEKAILSTQVLKLEDNIKELKAKLTGALSDKDFIIQENANLQLHLRRQPGSEGCMNDNHRVNAESHNNRQEHEPVLMKEEIKILSEVNEKLSLEHETMKQKFDASQTQLKELTAENLVNTKRIKELEAERSELMRQKDELLSTMKEGGHEMKEKCQQLKDSVQALATEKQTLQDECLCLDAKVLENEDKLHLLEEEYQKKDATRVQNIEELKAMVSHWTEKWQKVALTLQSTHEELEELKKKISRKESESEPLLRVELEACKQELELERNRSQTLLHRYKDQGDKAVQTEDNETVRDLSESSLMWEPTSDSPRIQNKSSQVTRCPSPPSLTTKAPEHSQDDEGQANVSTTDSLRTQLEESRRRADQLQQEKILAVQKLQTLKQLYLVKHENPPVEEEDEPLCPETVMQSRMVTEQLKGLFKKHEENEAGLMDNTSAAAQTETFSPQDWTPTVGRSAADRWSWQQRSGLMPVFEEDEESADLPGGEEEEEPAGDAHLEENLLSQGQHQTSTMSADLSKLKDKNENLLRDVRFKWPIQGHHTAADASLDFEVPILDECELQGRTPSLYPDGIFQAELIDICSPDDDDDDDEEEGGENK
uniref:centrosomal protein of 63 kDa-like n=1 Tax=Solea senegalensis TaxID=28829 RepID=UPI001CD82A3A|nr:centrosomal protein of 63 kDa-like [Solea senegalensis]